MADPLSNGADGKYRQYETLRQAEWNNKPAIPHVTPTDYGSEKVQGKSERTHGTRSMDEAAVFVLAVEGCGGRRT